MKRSLILMTLLVISSLMIAPALAQTLPQAQDQQTGPPRRCMVAAADETPSTSYWPREEAVSSKKVVVGNKDTKAIVCPECPVTIRSIRIIGSILTRKAGHH